MADYLYIKNLPHREKKTRKRTERGKMSSDGNISVKEEIEKYRKERKRIREEFKAGSTFNIMEFIKSPEGIKALATGRLGIIEEHLNETGFMDDDFVGLNWSFKLDIGKKLIISFTNPSAGFECFLVPS